MQDSGSFFNACKEYFSNTVMVPLFVIALIWLWKKWNIEKRYTLIIVGVISVFCVFNGGIYYIIDKLNEGDTYYRFFWILPIALLVAMAWTDIFVKVKKEGQYMMLLTLFVGCFVFSSRPLTNWINTPGNVYQVDDEVIEVSDALMELTEGKSTTIIENKNIRNELRQYNAKIGFAENESIELSNLLHFNDLNNLSKKMMYYLEENHSEYVVLEKGKPNSCRLIETTGADCVAETDNYYIYKTDYEQVSDDLTWVRETQVRIGMASTIEYFQSLDIEGIQEFVYITDLGTEKSEEFYREIVNVINERESQFVIINSQLAESVNWYLEHQEILADLEEPYYCNNQDFQVIEQEELVICMIDNITGVSEEAMQQFQNLKNRQIPILLVLSQEIAEEDAIYTEVMAEDSKVVAILSAREETFKKEMLEDRILQYATTTNKSTIFTIVRLKGREAE